MNDVKILPIRGSSIRKEIHINGVKHTVRQIGKGTFSYVYMIEGPFRGHHPPPHIGRAPESIWGASVLVHTCDETPDYSKRILSEITSDTRSKHLPKVKEVGMTDVGTLYQMPYYKAPLRKGDSATAWAQYKTLLACWEAAYQRLDRKYRGNTGAMIHSGHELQNIVGECARQGKMPKALLRALDLLAEYSANYGASYTLEFPRQNLATDKYGNLILLDPLFDRELAAKIRAKIRRKRAGLGVADQQPDPLAGTTRVPASDRTTVEDLRLVGSKGFGLPKLSSGYEKRMEALIGKAYSVPELLTDIDQWDAAQVVQELITVSEIALRDYRRSRRPGAGRGTSET